MRDDCSSGPTDAGATGAVWGAPFALASQCTGAALPSTIGAATVTRASSAYCPKSDGTFALVTSDQPRLGRFGVLVEGPATALETAPRDGTNAAWVKTNMTAALNQTGADGTANSATRITATANNATILQTYNDTAADRKTFGVSIRRPSGCGTGTVEVTEDNGAGFTCDVTIALAVGMDAGCQWVRVTQNGDTSHDTAQICETGCGALSSAIEDPVFGVKLATNADCLDFDFAQLEETISKFSTTPVVSGTRANEVFEIASASWPTAAGSIEMSMAPMWSPPNTNGDYRMIFDTRDSSSGDGVYVYDLDSSVTYGVRNTGGTSQTTTADLIDSALAPFGKPRFWQVEWDAAAVRINVQGVRRGTNTVAVNVPATNGTAKPGGIYSTNLWGYGWFSDINVVVSGNAPASTAVATVGDSILLGAWDVKIGDAMSIYLSDARQRKWVTPFAISGAKIDAAAGNCTSQYTTNVQGKTFDVIAYNCGINNLLAGESAAVAWGKSETLLNQMLSDGFRVVVANITPCNGYGPCPAEAVTAAYNVSLAAWCTTNAANCSLYDANAAMGDGVGALKTVCNTNCGSAAACDSLHPSNACSITYAQEIGALIP